MTPITPESMAREIQAQLRTRGQSRGIDGFDAPAYTLILGAGSSHGVVPTTREQMVERLGDDYYPDQDQSSLERPQSVLKKYSAGFWAEFNKASERQGLPTVAVDGRGLPTDPGEAYRTLFSYEGANALFRETEQQPATWVERYQRARQTTRNISPPAPAEKGTEYVEGFLQRSLQAGLEGPAVNPAHSYLALLLAAQEDRRQWATCPFCRTILTTNFDSLLQTALQQVGVPHSVTDRPQHGLALADFREEEARIHLVYTHGTVRRQNTANSKDEIQALAGLNINVLRDYLQTRDVITAGYSGWDDGLMGALRLCDGNRQRLYWCDVRPTPEAHVADFLKERGERAVYVFLGEKGADGLMRTLYQVLAEKDAE